MALSDTFIRAQLEGAVVAMVDSVSRVLDSARDDGYRVYVSRAAHQELINVVEHSRPLLHTVLESRVHAELEHGTFLEPKPEGSLESRFAALEIEE